MERAKYVYKQLNSIPLLQSARFVNNDTSMIEANFTQSLLRSQTKITLSAFYNRLDDKSSNKYSSSPLSMTFNKNVFHGKTLSAIFLEKRVEKNQMTFLQIRQSLSGTLLLEICLDKVCGKVLTKKSLLSGVSFSCDGARLAFVAQVKSSEKKPFQWNSNADKEGHEYDYEQTFGEDFSGISRTAIFVVDIAAAEITHVKSLDNKHSWAQVQFCPLNASVFVVIGFPQDKRQLGICHYNTRKSTMRLVDCVSGTVTHVAENDHSPSSPRFSPCGSQLLYLTTDATYLHASCARIRVLQVLTLIERTVVEIVNRPDQNTDFTGVWLRSSVLPETVWLPDSVHAVMCLQQRSRIVPIVVNTKTKSVVQLTLPEKFSTGSAFLLHICDYNLLLSLQDIARPPVLYMVDVHAVVVEAFNGLDSEAWNRVSASNTVQMYNDRAVMHSMQSMTYRIISFIVEGHPVEAIVMLPSRAEHSTPRLVVYPHGGPHSCFSTAFVLGNAFLVCMGLGVLLVNYRGSTGFGQEALETLPGNCGKNDVRDVVMAIEAAISSNHRLNKHSLCGFGGSHGGFITLSLIGQYPNLFQSAVCRNPVSNIAAMSSCSDIPDWCYIEAGMNFDSTRAPNEEQYAKMMHCSPISLAHQVTTPLLLLLGDADLRVPMSQSLDYFKLLQSIDLAETRCIVYPDNQALDDSQLNVLDVPLQSDHSLCAMYCIFYQFDKS